MPHDKYNVAKINYKFHWVVIKIIQELWITKLRWDFKSMLTLAAKACEWYRAFNCYYLYCIWWYKQVLILLSHYEPSSFVLLSFFVQLFVQKEEEKQEKKKEKFFLNCSILLIYRSMYLFICLFIYSYTCDIRRPPYTSTRYS